MVFRVEVWNGYPKGELLSEVDLPDEASPTARYALEHGAKSTAKQMLGKFGVEADLTVIKITNAQTHEAMRTQIEEAHAREAAGERLPNTDEALAGLE